MDEFQMQIEMDGLIKVLAENLYADPNVFIREMIQNAHDGITKRQMQGLAAGFTPAIHISQDPVARTLRFSDNGAGLTGHEIHRYLSTIGSSDKRTLAGQQDHQSMRKLIGQFGIGMLSSFIVADKVEVLTRSEGSPAFLWRSHGSATYTLEEAGREAVGTSVTIFLKPDQIRFLDAERFTELVRMYADLIGMPIFLNGAETPLNRIDAPWHTQHEDKTARHRAHADYWQARFPDEPVIELIPLDETFTYHEHGEQKQGRLSGTLGITSRRLPGMNAHPLVDLFVSRMFIGSGMRNLLPSWASFVRGVIECDELKPNAARDNIMPDGVHKAVKQSLGEAVVAWLLALARTDAARLREVLVYHHFQIIGMSIQPEHRELFDAVAGLIPLDSNHGPTSIDAYLERAEADANGVRTIYYFDDDDAATQGFMLAEAEGVQVINAGYSLVSNLLARYAELHRGEVRLKKIGQESGRRFAAVGADERARFDALAAACARLFEVHCSVSRFTPDDVPMLLEEAEAEQIRDEVADLSESPGLSDEIRELMKSYVAGQTRTPTLHLNIDNPVVQKLAMLIHQARPVAEQVLVLLYNNTVFLYARRIRPKQLKQLFGEVNRSMEMLVDAAEVIEQLQQENAELKSLLGDEVHGKRLI